MQAQLQSSSGAGPGKSVQKYKHYALYVKTILRLLLQKLKTGHILK
jgi:hypothetical protein